MGSPISLTAGSGGTYSASIPTSSLSPGLYEVVVNATYTFLGLQRTWFQAEGLQVGSSAISTTTTPTATNSTATTSTTTAPVDYTPYIYGGIAIVVIIVIAVALTRGRNRGGT